MDIYYVILNKYLHIYDSFSERWVKKKFFGIMVEKVVISHTMLDVW